MLVLACAFISGKIISRKKTEKIIKIVRNHDGNYTATQDDIQTTDLILQVISKYLEDKIVLDKQIAKVIFDAIPEESTHHGMATIGK